MEGFGQLYKSLKRAKPYSHGYDAETRDINITKDFFRLSNVPIRRIPAIVVTGSKGKGSTAIFTSALLQKMGYKVGLVTSPHLVDFCERIRINGNMIQEKNFLDILNRFAPIIDDIDAKLPKNKFLGPTGIILACAITHFLENDVNFMVLEAGRGGRFDETNLIPNLTTCITPIMNEHLDKLGPTVLDIAWNKVGLIKNDTTVISAIQQRDISKIIKDEAKSKNANLLRIGREIFYETKLTSNNIQEVSIQIPSFQVKKNIQIQSNGLYQGMNLAVALGAVASVAKTKLINIEISTSMLGLSLPGRCQMISNEPTVIVDGAINRGAAIEFKKSILNIKRPLILVTALPNDKDAVGLLSELAPLVNTVIITTARSPVLNFSNKIINIAKRFSKRALEISIPEDAFKFAVAEAKEIGMIWVVGTQSLVRDALIYWNQREDSLWTETFIQQNH